MSVERGSSSSSLIDVLDRVLDKGIVIDAWVRVSIVGIDIITVEARVVVASIETYMKYAETLENTQVAPRGLAEPARSGARAYAPQLPLPAGTRSSRGDPGLT